ncbi:hypothetical protein WAX74_12245 [Psychrobacillus sp. FJAT-51614]|uniref:Keratin n=1 Tax=Psychrobacillus mangrovi TaxID=3117745 RepID=A0ABU8F5V5_9BACI
MNNSDAFDLCCRYYGKRVRITCRDGSVHVGEITRVRRNIVWIQPDNNLGGYGLGFFGDGFGFGSGFGFGIALGAITGIVLASAFFW